MALVDRFKSAANAGAAAPPLSCPCSPVSTPSRGGCAKLASACCDGSAAAAPAAGATAVDPPCRDDFQDVEVLGTGSFGSVVLAVNRRTGQKVALKSLAKKRLNTKKRFEHAMNERRALEVVDSQFTTKLVCAFQDQTHLYLALEYVESGELFHLLRWHGPMREPAATFYVAQIALALRYLHDHRMVHRDVKPENVLVDSRGFVKLTDFGFCKQLEDDRTYSVCGTPEYTAPEIVLGQGYGHAVDWWSLGVLAFEMVCGYSPFKKVPHERRHLLLKRIVDAKVRYPPKFSPEFRSLLGGLLSRDTALRRRAGEGAPSHPWFARTDWAAIEARSVPPPIAPRGPFRGGYG